MAHIPTLHVGYSCGRCCPAIWLGGYRSRSYVQGRVESFTLAELAALIDETARTKSVIEVWWCKTNRRESFRLRLKVGFCGDSARSDGVR